MQSKHSKSAPDAEKPAIAPTEIVSHDTLLTDNTDAQPSEIDEFAPTETLHSELAGGTILTEHR